MIGSRGSRSPGTAASSAAGKLGAASGPLRTISRNIGELREVQAQATAFGKVTTENRERMTMSTQFLKVLQELPGDAEPMRLPPEIYLFPVDLIHLNAPSLHTDVTFQHSQGIAWQDAVYVRWTP